MRHKSNLKELKDRNKKLILKLLINRGALSRTELSQYTGLSLTAVSDLVDDLISENLIKESGIGTSTGGRRPILLEFNPESGYIAGFRVTEDKIITMLFDFNMKKIVQRETNFNYFEVAKLEEKIKESYFSMEREFCSDTKKIFGIGLCLSKDVRTLNPKGILTTSISAEYMTLEQSLSLELGIVAVEEDELNLKALAEYLSLQRGNNLAYININDTIESSVIINGKFLESKINIGHLIVDNSGPKCHEGHRGCLNTLISTKAIIKKALIMMLEESISEKDKIKDFASIDIDNLTEFLSETGISKLINEVNDYLQIAIINLKNLLNIKTFVFDGKILKLSGLINTLIKSFDNLTIKESSISDEDVMREVARITLKKLINYEEV